MKMIFQKGEKHELASFGSKERGNISKLLESLKLIKNDKIIKVVSDSLREMKVRGFF